MTTRTRTNYFVWNFCSRVALRLGVFAPVFCCSCPEQPSRLREGSFGRRQILNIESPPPTSPPSSRNADAGLRLLGAATVLSNSQNSSEGPLNALSQLAKQQERQPSLSAPTKNLLPRRDTQQTA